MEGETTVFVVAMVGEEVEDDDEGSEDADAVELFVDVMAAVVEVVGLAATGEVRLEVVDCAGLEDESAWVPPAVPVVSASPLILEQLN